MNALRPLWMTPEVLQASADRRYGVLARLVRLARHETLAQVAGRCHIDASALSRLERGQRGLKDVDLLRALATQLDVPVQLFGLSPTVSGAAERREIDRAVSVGPSPIGRQDGDEAMRRRRFLAGIAGVATAGMLPGTANAAAAGGTSLEALILASGRREVEPLPLAVLRRVLDTAQVAYDNCEYHTLMSSLPDVIASAHVSCADAVSAVEKQQLSIQLARAYLLGSELAINSNGNTIAGITADRALTAARDSGDPFTIATSSRQVAIAMRRDALNAKEATERLAGLDGAVRMLTSTALDLNADHGEPDPRLLATYGSLLCTASYSAAQNGKPGQAIALIEEAEHAANRLSKPVHGIANAQFSQATVAVYRIGVHTALGDTASAVTYASSVIPSQLPTAERRVRFQIDASKAWIMHGDSNRATETLTDLGHTAPHELRRPSVRRLISQMLEAPGPAPSGLQTLAARALS